MDIIITFSPTNNFGFHDRWRLVVALCSKRTDTGGWCTLYDTGMAVPPEVIDMTMDIYDITARDTAVAFTAPVEQFYVSSSAPPHIHDTIQVQS